jgi:hypothetical protein
MRLWRATTRRTNPQLSRRRIWMLIGASAAALTVAGVAAAEATGGWHSSPQAVHATAPSAVARDAASGRPSPSSRARTAVTARVGASTRPAAPAAHAAAPAAAQPPRSSCTSVAHVGDSTSVDLISASTLPNPTQQLTAQYSGVGVQHLLMDASGGRSIVEQMPGQINGYKVASNWWNQGYRGCWVFALGTNDAADVSVGSDVGIAARIQEMMAVAHGEPVMWVNTITQRSSGPWSEANEKAWDSALVSALGSYPNMRIFNWAATAEPGWFLSDGIHYNSAGCAARAQAIAAGLAQAFPAGGHSPSQIVG